MPVQCVTAARVLPPGPGSLWQWLGQLPDPRDPRGVRFSLPCVLAIAMAARLAGCESFTAIGEWAASRPAAGAEGAVNGPVRPQRQR